MTYSTYAVNTDTGRKVHIEVSFHPGVPSCARAVGRVRERLVELVEAGEGETIAALLGAGIPPAALCATCFGTRLRVRYAAAARRRVRG